MYKYLVFIFSIFFTTINSVLITLTNIIRRNFKNFMRLIITIYFSNLCFIFKREVNLDPFAFTFGARRGAWITQWFHVISSSGKSCLSSYVSTWNFIKIHSLTYHRTYFWILAYGFNIYQIICIFPNTHFMITVALQ